MDQKQKRVPPTCVLQAVPAGIRRQRFPPTPFKRFPLHGIRWKRFPLMRQKQAAPAYAVQKQAASADAASTLRETHWYSGFRFFCEAKQERARTMHV